MIKHICNYYTSFFLFLTLFENSRFTVLLALAMIGVAILALGYLTWYVSPTEIAETVEIIANTENGCIAETLDGFSVNIGACDAKAGDMITAMVDTKFKEREAAMNP